ncbi:hypothetical protein A2U01_0065193, partial [Trifolium medium]|nr:hypothetical protein [Trifolium medium]
LRLLILVLLCFNVAAAHGGPSVNVTEKLTADNHFHIAVLG